MDKKNSAYRFLPLSFACLWSLILLFSAMMEKNSFSRFLLKALSSIYIGYNSSIGGAFIGSFLGFVDAMIGGFLALVIYKTITKKILPAQKSLD